MVRGALRMRQNRPMDMTSTDGVSASPSVAECGRLVEAATRLIDERQGSENHTVAAVALDADGHLHGAVNVHHFTGGPCAELVAIGVAAAATRAPLVAMVAVGDRGRGVMSPCGRCRQVMLDYFPNIVALVLDGAAVRAVPIGELLPWSVDRHEQREPEASGTSQVVHFGASYLEAARAGVKRTTIRFRDPVAVGPAILLFECDPPVTLPAAVTRVVPTVISRLTDDDAVRDGFRGRAELIERLGVHYPGIADDDSVTIVHFNIRE